MPVAVRKKDLYNSLMISLTDRINVFGQLAAWYFYDVPRNILNGWRNFLVFGMNFFSVPLLLKTFFAYWRKYRWSFGRGFDLKTYLEAIILNLFSRLIGACARTIFIIFGLTFELLIAIVGLAVFVSWFGIPLLLIGGLYFGGRFLFT